jgi:transmembrane sensor
MKKISEQQFKEKDTENKILLLSSGLMPPSGISDQEALEKIKGRIASPKPGTFKLKPLYWSAAAMIVLFLSAYFGFITVGKSKVVTRYAQIKEITLPDGTFVMLNAGSTAKYNKKEFIDNRRLELEGEAFFKVTKGSRFEIQTTNGTVEILGTQLDVLSRGTKFNVGCISGKVSVTALNQRQEITAGQKTELKGVSLVKIENIDPTTISSWKNGDFNFEDEPLVYIFEELERQFNVRFDLPSVEGRKYTGGFNNRNLEEALSQVCIPMGLKYDIKNKKRIIITNKM